MNEFSFREIRTGVNPSLYLIAFEFGVNQENWEAGGVQDSFVPLCNFSGGNLRQSCQTSTKELLCINSQEPKHNDCFGKKNPPPQTSDQILNVDPTRSDLRRCKSGVWVQCKCLEFVAVGWCRRKWLRLYQTIGNLTSGDMGILLVLIRQGVTD